MVMGIIALLAAIVITAINPSKQLANTRNSARQSDANTIVNAVYQYAIDTGKIPSTITATDTPICKSTVDPIPSDCVNLRMLTGTYLAGIPVDPLVPAGSGWTGYYIVKDAIYGRVSVTARKAEYGATIDAIK